MLSVSRPDQPRSLREDVQTWLSSNVPEGWRQELVGASESEIEEFLINWMKAVAGAGLAAAALPIEYGGAGLCLKDQIIIIEEMARADAPPLDMFMVTRTHAPLTILEWGTEEQKRKYLPGIAGGELWCQAFSEPNAGSDLAALRTSARRDGDDYVISGQKIWSSFSRHARYALLLARTDSAAEKRKGITYFLLDMKLPGIEVRPILQATGNSEFSEIFLNEVRVSAADIIGPLNGGWAVAQSTLAAERGVLAFERVERLWCNFMRFLQRSAADQQPWLKDEQKISELAQIIGLLEGERQLIRRFMAAEDSRAGTSKYPPIIKLTSTEIAQAVADFVLRASGMPAQLFRRGFEQDGVSPMFDYIFTFGNTISAGTNEVMRNIIAERVLGMPR